MATNQQSLGSAIFQEDVALVPDQGRGSYRLTSGTFLIQRATGSLSHSLALAALSMALIGLLQLTTLRLQASGIAAK